MRWEHEDGSETFHPEREGVWEHSCGSQFFYLNDDGTVTCADSKCGHTLAGFRWVRDRVS